MISTSENKLLKVNGKFIRNKVKTLSYTVTGRFFPAGIYNDSSPEMVERVSFLFHSKTANNVTVSYGDGVFETYRFREETPGNWVFGWRGPISYWGPAQSYDPPAHLYVDGNTGERTISFEFSDLEAISFNPIFGVYVVKTPIEWIYTRIENIFMQVVFLLQSLDVISLNTTEITLSELVFANRLTTIPDQWFESKNVENIGFRQNFNLSDPISSNLFKINQWKSLRDVNLFDCIVTEIPIDSINELTSLQTLELGNNPITSIPSFGNLPNLRYFSIDCSYLTDNKIPDWNGLPKLKLITFKGLSNFNNIRLDVSTIPQNWKGLYAMDLIYFMFLDNQHFDDFINALYELVTLNGNILANSAPQPYPNRFRNIAWGDENRSLNGSKIAPAGYAQGVSNGSPINQGQKAYVLQNQYNHVITHA